MKQFEETRGRKALKEPKTNTTLRLYPKDKEKLIKKFGGLQAAFDFLVDTFLNDFNGSKSKIQKFGKTTKQ